MSYTVGGGAYFYTRLMEYLVSQKNIKVGIIDFYDGLFPEYVKEMHSDWDIHHVNINDFEWNLEDNSVIFCPLEWTCLIHRTPAKNVRIATIVWESEIGWNILFEKKELKELSQLVNTKDAVCFIDTSLVKVVRKQLKTDFKDVVLPLYAEMHSEKFIHKQVNPNEINLIWLGRLSPTKIMSLENIIKNFALYDTDKKKKFHIIGDGNALEALKEFCKQFSDIEFIFLGVMTGDKLDDYLKTKTDLAIAMGTSCLNCADLGLPSIWAHECPTPFFCDQFVWMYEQVGYNLSSSAYPQYRSGQERFFGDMMDDCFKKNKLTKIAAQCRDYARKAHGDINLVGGKFFDIISNSGVYYEDLKKIFKKMPYNQVRVKRLKIFGVTVYKTETFYNTKRFYLFGFKFLTIKQEGNTKKVHLFFISIKSVNFGGYTFPDITNRALRYTNKKQKRSNA